MASVSDSKAGPAVLRRIRSFKIVTSGGRTLEPLPADRALSIPRSVSSPYSMSLWPERLHA
jgi:hypothetical protein